MVYAMGILEVRNFTEWKSAHDIEEGVALRKASGMKSYRILKSNENPNKIVHLSQWDNIDDARKFLHSEELQRANEQSGVIEMSSVYFLEEVENKSV
jgi:heme-degrading monooxygenase HmoA